MKHPLVLPALGFSSGIAIARLADFGLAGSALAAVAFGCLGGLAQWRGSPRLVGVCVFLAALQVGVLDAVWQAQPPVPLLQWDPLKIAGCVVEPTVANGDQLRFVLELQPGARMRVNLPPRRDGTPAPELRYGQRVEVPAQLRAVRGFHNPGGFDLEGWLRQRQIYWTATASRSIPPTVLAQRCGTSAMAARQGLRSAALARIDRLYASDRFERGMLRGLLLGDKSEMQKQWSADWRKTGTYHALVISGSHITLVCGLLLLWRRKFRYGSRTVLAVAALTGWVYAIVAGADAPVLRAAAGFTLAVAGQWCGRRLRVLNLLAAAVMLFLALDPGQLFDASFQLSFLAVAAIGTFAPDSEPGPFQPRRMSRQLERRLLAETLHFVLRIPLGWCRAALDGLAWMAQWLWQPLRLTLAVQVGLALPMVLYFHRLSVTGPLANALAVPVVSLAIPCGFLAVFTGWTAPAWLAGRLLHGSQAIVSWHALREPDWRIPDPPLWLAGVLTAALLVLAASWRRKWVKPAAAAACAAALALLALHPFRAQHTAGTLELSALDVGQGDALALMLPDGEAVVVDAGGLPNFGRREKAGLETGEDVVSPYLWRRGVRRLAVVAVTHLHEDHAGGARALIENFRPREVWTGLAPPAPAWQEIESAARRCGAAVRVLRQGDRGSLGGVAWEVLSPAADQRWRGRALNNDSLVLRLRYGRHTFLLSGDMDTPVERRLLDLGLAGPADVLKVAHHGSSRSTSADWLDALRPAVAIISVGADNSYGLPNERTLEELGRRHIRVARTDLSGLVRVRSDGRYLDVGTFGQGDGSWGQFVAAWN